MQEELFVENVRIADSSLKKLKRVEFRFTSNCQLKNLKKFKKSVDKQYFI